MTTKVKLSPSQDRSEVLRFDRPNLMLVEGPDDQTFAAVQATTKLVPADWHIHSMGGNKTNWGAVVDLALDDDWFRENGHSISLVRDGDNDPAASIMSLRSLLMNRKLPQPSGHATIAEDSGLKTGIFVMPDGIESGALEELLLRGLPDDRRKAAESYIDSVTTAFGAVEYPQKSVVLAYFAGHTEFVKSIPVAVQKHDVISPSSPAYDSFAKFMAELAS